MFSMIMLNDVHINSCTAHTCHLSVVRTQISDIHLLTWRGERLGLGLGFLESLCVHSS